MGAAPRSRRNRGPLLLIAAIVALNLLVTAGTGSAAVNHITASPGLWGVELAGTASAHFDAAAAKRLHTHRVGLVVVDGDHVSPAAVAHVRSIAAANHLTVLTYSTRRAAVGSCPSGLHAPCTFIVGSPAAALRLAASVPLRVVVRAHSAADVRRLAKLRHGRLVVIADLPRRSGQAAWLGSAKLVASNPRVALAVHMSAPTAAAGLNSYFSLLSQAAKTSKKTAGTSVPRTPASADPVAPTGLTTGGRSSTSIALSWQAAQAPADSYVVYVDGARAGTTATLSYTVTGLACATSHLFEVASRSVDGAESSSRAGVSDSTTACPGSGGGGGGGSSDALPPSTPLTLTGTGATTTTITVSWPASTDNVGVTGYTAYRGGASVGTTASTTYTYSGLTCGTSYTLGVDAYDAANNHSGQASLTTSTSACVAPGDTTAPTAPTGLTKTAATVSSVSLSWTASTDNVGVAGYSLTRNGVAAGTTATRTTTFTGLACGTTYTLGVAAYDAAGNASSRTTLSAATSACAPAGDTQAPTAPSGLAVNSTTQTSLSLSWSASTDNVGVTGYGLYGAGSGTVAATSTSVAGLACGTSYTVQVDAFDAAGNHSAKTSVTASTLACSGGGGGGTANVYVSTSGSDSTCVRSNSSKPCASFNKGFQIAQSGDVVEVAAGAYGSQSIAQSTKTSAVTVRPATGANVTVSSLSVNASHFHIEGIVAAGSGQTRGDLSICSSECNPGLVDVLIKDGGFRSAFIRSSNVTVDGGDYGGFDACQSNAPEDGFRLWAGSIDTTPTNDTVRNAWIHDIQSGSGNTCQGTVHAGWHIDCMQNEGGANVLISNNVFTGCPTSDIQMNPFGTGNVIHDVTVDNNYFGQTACCNSIALGTQGTDTSICPSLAITNNRYFTTPNLNNCAGKGVVITGNTMCSSTTSPTACVPPTTAKSP